MSRHDCCERWFRTVPSTVELFQLLTLSRSTCLSKATKVEIGWEAGIRTPITWSRATCPTVERPPRIGTVRLRSLRRAASFGGRRAQGCGARGGRKTKLYKEEAAWRNAPDRLK